MLIAELFRNNVLVFETVYDLLNDSENNQRVYMMRIAQLLTFVEVHKSRQGIIYLKSFFFEHQIETHSPSVLAQSEGVSSFMNLSLSKSA